MGDVKFQVTPEMIEAYERDAKLAEKRELGSASWQIRVEALRAAVQLATCDGLAEEGEVFSLKQIVSNAEQFARWLETGER